MVSDAPSWQSRSSFLSLLEVAITRAPTSFANWSAKMETPPAIRFWCKAPAEFPSSNSSAGKRGGLFVRKIIWNVHKPVLVQHHVLGKHPVDRPTQGGVRIRRRQPAGNPTLQKDCGHP